MGFLCTFGVYVQLAWWSIRARLIRVGKDWIEACFRKISYKSKSNPISIISQDSCQFYWPNSVYYMYTTIADQNTRFCSRREQEQKLKNWIKSVHLISALEDDSRRLKDSNHFLAISWSQQHHLQPSKRQESSPRHITVCQFSQIRLLQFTHH